MKICTICCGCTTLSRRLERSASAPRLHNTIQHEQSLHHTVHAACLLPTSGSHAARMAYHAFARPHACVVVSVPESIRCLRSPPETNSYTTICSCCSFSASYSTQKPRRRTTWGWRRPATASICREEEEEGGKLRGSEATSGDLNCLGTHKGCDPPGHTPLGCGPMSHRLWCLWPQGIYSIPQGDRPLALYTSKTEPRISGINVFAIDQASAAMTLPVTCSAGILPQVFFFLSFFCPWGSSVPPS